MDGDLDGLHNPGSQAVNATAFGGHSEGPYSHPVWKNAGAASCSGVAIPLLLRRLGIDAALAGGVVTAVTDCVGFMTLLGLGTIFLR